MSHRLLLAAFMFSFGLLPAFAQTEEEETTPRKPLKKIEVPDEPPGRNTIDPPAGQPVLAAYSAKLAVPCDRITLAAGNALRIVPVPLVFGRDKYPDEFGIQPLDDRNDTGDLQTFTPAQVRGILHFEQFAINESEALLKLTGANVPPKAARLAAVEKGLDSVLAYHEKAVAAERRLGKNWDKFKTALVEKLLVVRLGMAKEAAAAKDWKALREVVQANAERYMGQPKVLAELAALRLLEAEDLAQRDIPSDWEQAIAVLRDFESRYPMAKSDTATRIRTALLTRARQLLEKARGLIDSNPGEARNLLRTVEVLDPNATGLQELRSRMRSSLGTLVVGTRRMPERMSPALARFDSEKQIVELLFEGLLEAVPEETLGVNYRSTLALGKPRGSAGMREIDWIPQAEWADGTPLTVADAVGTLELQREKRQAFGTYSDLFEEFAAQGNTLRLRFRPSLPDPRESLTFKVLPARAMRERKQARDDESFARNPLGSGPYRLPAGFVPASEGLSPKDFPLVPNAGYAKRYPGQPTIREIRYAEIAGVRDLADEVKNDRLHILTDVPTADLPKFEALPNAVVATAANNRRVHFLAVNHRNPVLQDAGVRRGIQAAIDRETILNDVFRAGMPKHHKAMNGPFPPDSWAVPRGNAAPLFQPAARIAGASATPLTLIYPDDEPLVQAACERIAKQVSAAGLPVKAEGVPPRAFLIRLEREHRYDLAYVAYDYPNDWYPPALAQLLDGSAADRGGRNYMGYLAPKTNATEADRRFAALFAGFDASRDFEGVWKPRAVEIQARFAEVVPFVPLWQLDRHMVVSKNVKLPYPVKLLNPTTLFADVRNWKFIESK